jgi:glycosyltransferase involved in cell wall biosynthesis
MNDPVSRQAAASLADAGWQVDVFNAPPINGVSSSVPKSVRVFECPGPTLSREMGPLYRIAKWRKFRRELQRYIKINRPALVVTIMLHALAALPDDPDQPFSLVSCIYDIPSPEDAGRLDSQIFRNGWKRLGDADVVWSSDAFKAELARKFGKLERSPLVCHNCPPIGYLPKPTWPRDPWLRTELQRQGAEICDRSCILLRAGAIGEAGGIEATLEAVRRLPDEYIFLMMGRPSREYSTKLLARIADLDIRKRAFLWEQSSDEVWNKALQGADIGHLIHGPFPPGRMQRLYELNSSLSNYRLFFYMAAGLPVLSYDDSRLDAIHNEVDCFRVLQVDNLVEEMYQALLEMGNPALRMKLGEAGRKAHENRYSWEHQFGDVMRAVSQYKGSGCVGICG